MSRLSPPTLLLLSSLAAALVAGAPACNGGSAADPSLGLAVGAGDASVAAAFEPVPPAVYVAKVKNLLVGLPPTATVACADRHRRSGPS